MSAAGLTVAELIAGLPIRRVSGPDPVVGPPVTGVTLDSRKVAAGDLFVAVPGARLDGRAFAGMALERGAVAVLAAPGGAPAAWPSSVYWLETPDAETPRALAGPLAARVYGHPERDLILAAVTGTNGKSTTATVLGALLDAAGLPAAVLGTIGYGFRDQVFPADRTTPEAPELIGLLRRFHGAGARAATMEASSHALALHRLAGLAFDVAIFTNLTRDHLDFHQDLEDYFQAKRRLFTMLKPGGRAAVHVDDSHGARLAAEMPEALTFGTRPDTRAEVRMEGAQLSAEGIRGTLVTPRGRFEIHSTLLGRYNLENLLAAVAGAEALGLPSEAIVRGVAERGPVVGRLEPVKAGQPFPVFVDFAHTPAGLESLLRSVREFTGKRPIVVFGAGGDKDRGKRGPMGRVVGELAALPILTSDNPRGEDPLEILWAVEAGIKESGNTQYRLVPDRREAIRRAVAVAGPDDVVVVAGKGHEAFQETAGVRTPFSDQKELQKALEERFGHAASR